MRRPKPNRAPTLDDDAGPAYLEEPAETDASKSRRIDNVYKVSMRTLRNMIPPMPKRIPDRVKYIVDRMAVGDWDRGVSTHQIARVWGKSVTTIEGYAAEAWRLVKEGEDEQSLRVRQIKEMMIRGRWMHGIFAQRFADRWGISERRVVAYETEAMHQLSSPEVKRSAELKRQEYVLNLEAWRNEALGSNNLSEWQKHRIVNKHLELASRLQGMQVQHHHHEFGRALGKLLEIVERVAGEELSEKIQEAVVNEFGEG